MPEEHQDNPVEARKRRSKTLRNIALGALGLGAVGTAVYLAARSKDKTGLESSRFTRGKGRAHDIPVDKYTTSAANPKLGPQEERSIIIEPGSFLFEKYKNYPGGFQAMLADRGWNAPELHLGKVEGTVTGGQIGTSHMQKQGFGGKPQVVVGTTPSKVPRQTFHGFAEDPYTHFNDFPGTMAHEVRHAIHSPMVFTPMISKDRVFESHGPSPGKGTVYMSETGAELMQALGALKGDSVQISGKYPRTAAEIKEVMEATGAFKPEDRHLEKSIQKKYTGEGGRALRYLRTAHKSGFLDKLLEYVERNDLMNKTVQAGKDPMWGKLASDGLSDEEKEWTDTQDRFDSQAGSILEKIKAEYPDAMLASGVPADIGKVSDVDIMVYREGVPEHREERMMDGRPVNILVTGDPARKRALEHRRVESELFRSRPDLVRKVIEAKKSGAKTEPAWASVLGLEGDPYEAMASYGRKSAGDENSPRLISTLLSHQQSLVDALEDTPGMVAVHGTGSGKTISSIASAVLNGLPIDAVVPAALRENYRKEIRKHVAGEYPHRVRSYDEAARDGDVTPGSLLVLDEAHRIRNPGTTRSDRMMEMSPHAAKRLALTGTPVYNKPADLGRLINFAAGRHVLPEDQKEFNKTFLLERKVEPGPLGKLIGADPASTRRIKHAHILKDAFRRYVHFHPSATKGFPERQDHVVNLDMTPQQTDVYRGVMSNAPWWLRYKIRKRLPASMRETKDLNAFLSGQRQVANTESSHDITADPDSSPKFRAVVDHLKQALADNPNHRAVVFSPYLKSGVGPVAAMLAKEGIGATVFHGGLADKERAEAVAGYNEGRKPVLLVSGAGAEGLDLKGTRSIHVLNQHFNRPLIDQVIGRGIRYGSHAHLPEDQRKVDVYEYLARPRARGLRRLFGQKSTPGVDEWLRNMALEKQSVADQIYNMMRESQEERDLKLKQERDSQR